MGARHHSTSSLLERVADVIGQRLVPTGGPDEPSEPLLEEIRPGISFGRLESPLPRTAVVYPAALCIVARGSKHVRVGGRMCTYDEGSFLLSAMDLPAEVEVSSASREVPMLSLLVSLDMSRVATLATELRDVVPVDTEAVPVIGTHRLDEPLAMAVLRLVRATSSDTEWAVLSDGLLRELYYRLMTGPAAGALLTRLRSAGSAEQVARAIEFIKVHLTEPLDVETLAKTAGLSASGLHSKFKQVTSLSPMQYVKRFRLDRANAMIVAGESVTSAAFAVGYASPSQFSRDFKRRYGVPPSRVSAA